MRCCKDLGIASELWDPTFIKAWKEEFTEKIWCTNEKTNEKRMLWRRKDRSFIQYPWVEQSPIQGGNAGYKPMKKTTPPPPPPPKTSYQRQNAAPQQTQYQSSYQSAKTKPQNPAFEENEELEEAGNEAAVPQPPSYQSAKSRNNQPAQSTYEPPTNYQSSYSQQQAQQAQPNYTQQPSYQQQQQPLQGRPQNQAGAANTARQIPKKVGARAQLMQDVNLDEVVPGIITDGTQYAGTYIL